MQGYNVVRVVLHLRQPVDDELVGFTGGQTYVHQLLTQEFCGISSGNAEAFAHIEVRCSLALPVEAVILVAVRVVKRTVGHSGDAPAVVILRVCAGELSAVWEVYFHRNIRFFLGIEVDDGFFFCTLKRNVVVCFVNLALLIGVVNVQSIFREACRRSVNDRELSGFPYVVSPAVDLR